MKNPNFLILDEPTNDLDIMTLNVLEEYLLGFKGTVIIVSHDRYFIDKVAETLFIFEGNGKIKNFPGNYSAYYQYLYEKEKEQKNEVKKLQVKDVKVKKDNSQKLSYKEKVEFEKLEEEIVVLSTEKTEIENYMNSGDFSDGKLEEKAKRLSELEEFIDEKEFRWLELSDKA